MKKLVAFLTLFMMSLDVANAEPTDYEIASSYFKDKFEKLGIPSALQGEAYKRAFITNMLCLKITDAHGKRINPKKSDLNDIRKKFALELNRMNIDATATIRKKSKDWQRWKNY
jgi:nickase/relaxase